MRTRESQSWHISAPVDCLAYHFSWLLALVPLAWNGRSGVMHLTGAWVMLLSLVITFLHRHLSLPYAYLDGEVFRAHRAKLVGPPALVVLAFLATPYARENWAPAKAAFPAFVFGIVLWNIWHVLMQKYGILRVYHAKLALPAAKQIPGWVDRALLWSWSPLFFVYLLPKHKAVAMEYGPSLSSITGPVADHLLAWQPFLLPIAWALPLISFAAFLRYQAHAGWEGSAPRLTAAAGTMGIYLSFLFLDPVHAYVAFGLNHAVEYMVFVWAFLRKKYPAHETRRATLLGKALRRPWLAYAGFYFGTAALYIFLRHWNELIAPGADPWVIAGQTTATWVFYWNIFESVLHFYFDGFLWKIRRPEVASFVTGKSSPPQGSAPAPEQSAA